MLKWTKMEWKREISYVSERKKVIHVTNMLVHVINSKLIQVHTQLFFSEFKNLNLIKSLSQSSNIEQERVFCIIFNVFHNHF